MSSKKSFIYFRYANPIYMSRLHTVFKMFSIKKKLSWTAYSGEDDFATYLVVGGYYIIVKLKFT